MNKWDWVWMYYCARVLLGLSEQEFWQLTPRKLNALMTQYFGSANETNSKAFEELMEM